MIWETLYSSHKPTKQFSIIKRWNQKVKSGVFITTSQYCTRTIFFFLDCFIATIYTKKEIKLACISENDPLYWVVIKNAAQYQKRLNKSGKGYTHNDVLEFDWEKDLVKRVTKIWVRWRTRRECNYFPCYIKTLNNGNLIKISSCASERVFSYLGLIRQTCMYHFYKYTTHIQLFL